MLFSACVRSAIPYSNRIVRRIQKNPRYTLPEWASRQYYGRVRILAIPLASLMFLASDNDDERLLLLSHVFSTTS